MLAPYKMQEVISALQQEVLCKWQFILHMTGGESQDHRPMRSKQLCSDPHVWLCSASGGDFTSRP